MSTMCSGASSVGVGVLEVGFAGSSKSSSTTVSKVSPEEMTVRGVTVAARALCEAPVIAEIAASVVDEAREEAREEAVVARAEGMREDVEAKMAGVPGVEEDAEVLADVEVEGADGSTMADESIGLFKRTPGSGGSTVVITSSLF